MCTVNYHERQAPAGLEIGWTCAKTGLPANPTPSGNGVYCEKFCDFEADQKTFEELRRRNRDGDIRSTAPRFMKCPVCDSEDTLNVNTSAPEYATDFCTRCNTDIHSDQSYHFEGESCAFGCEKRFCYCDAREEWKKKAACEHAFVEKNDPQLPEYVVTECPKCGHYQMRKK